MQRTASKLQSIERRSLLGKLSQHPSLLAMPPQSLLRRHRVAALIGSVIIHIRRRVEQRPHLIAGAVPEMQFDAWRDREAVPNIHARAVCVAAVRGGFALDAHPRSTFFPFFQPPAVPFDSPLIWQTRIKALALTGVRAAAGEGILASVGVPCCKDTTGAVVRVNRITALASATISR